MPSQVMPQPEVVPPPPDGVGAGFGAGAGAGFGTSGLADPVELKPPAKSSQTICLYLEW